MKRFSFLQGFLSISLRNRIAFYYTFTTALLILLVFTAIYFTVDRVVYGHFDEDLSREVAETLWYANMTSHTFKDFSNFKANDINDDHDEQDNDDNKARHEIKHQRRKKTDVDQEFIQIINSANEIVVKSANLNTNVLTFNPHEMEMLYSNSQVGNSTVRQVQTALFTRDGQFMGYLIIAVPMKSAIIVLRNLQDVFFVAFPLILIILFALTRLIAGRSIRPIDKVIATAEQMSQTNLDQRIALPYHHDELYRLSATINALFDRMESAFLREKHFTADASHELKTPLAVVKGTLDVLIRKPRDREHYETRIKFCLKELDRMAYLIDQLLMLARYESSKVTPRIVVISFAPLLENVVERMLETAQSKGISITINHAENTPVAADPGMLEMMIENIISNAIKYSAPNSFITVAVTRNNEQVLCSITDQGIGIPEEKLNAIFDRFYRVDEARCTNTGGLGLGLSIVKKLADLQQIKVTVTSAINKGTTFTLTCPTDTINA